MPVVEINDKNFDSEVVNAKEVVLVDFWAPWCGPCKTMGPVVDSLAETLGNRYKFCKINIDENRELAQRYNIMSIPTLMVFKDGKVCNVMTGAADSDAIVNMLGGRQPL